MKVPCGPLAACLALAALACNTESLNEPDAGPALAAAASQAPLSFRMVSTGNFESCGVTNDNRVYCWGHTTSGFVEGSLRFRLVSVGNDHICGVTTDDRAYCWGANFSGQLGDGTTTSRTQPTAVFGGLRFASVRAGFFHTCGVTLTHQGYCWGSNFSGQVGDGSEFNRRQRPVLVAGGLSFRQIIPGGNSTCGVTTGNKAYCWGYGGEGQTGDGTTVQERRSPRAVAGGHSFRQVASGGAHSCGVTTNDRALCWGNNFEGRLGDGTTTRRLRPVAVVGGLQFARIELGPAHTCAVTTANRAYCWGNNTAGQLGDGSNSHRTRPAAVSGNLPFRQVDAGGSGENGHTCGVTTDDQAYCWGNNNLGQLGDGTTDNSSTPVAVAGPA